MINLRQKKRFNLKKDPDLLAQQQIKNDQDLINGIHESIRDIFNKIDQIANSCSTATAKSLHAYKELEIRMERLELLYKEELLTRQRESYQMSSQFSTLKAETEYAVKDAKEKVEKLQSIPEDINFVSEQVVDLCNVTEKEVTKLKNSISASHQSALIGIDNLRQDVDKFPSPLPILASIIAYKEQIDAVNKGFREEIETVKRESHYNVKKIENLYTLIDRLKGDKCLK